MASRCSNTCVYSICDPERWLRSLSMGESPVPQCANHPLWPGQVHDVPGVACKNYRPRPVAPRGDNVRCIPLGNGLYAYVDAADYEWLRRWTWHAGDDGYPARYEKRKKIYMHRQIMQPSKGKVVDHIDANKANNCRFNLRECNRHENMRNNRKHCNASSQYKGVSYLKRRRKYVAAIWFEGTSHFLGYHADEAAAARAYDLAAVQFCGEFARLNFPRDWPPERRAQVHAEYLQTATRPAPKSPRRPARKRTPARVTRHHPRTTPKKVRRSQATRQATTSKHEMRKASVRSPAFRRPLAS